MQLRPPPAIAKGDPAGQILDLHQKNTALKQALLPGEDKMKGGLCGIDAVGHEAIDYRDAQHRQSNVVLEQLIRRVDPTGHLGIIGIYRPEDPCGQTEAIEHGELQIGFGELVVQGAGGRHRRGAGGALQPLPARPDRRRSGQAERDRYPAAPPRRRPRGLRQVLRACPGYVKVVLKPGLAA